jgi:DNA-binding transcriptional ArsR family regulator
MSSKGKEANGQGSGAYIEAEPANVSPSVDELYEIFANKRRRYVLHYLKQEEGRTEFGEMAEQIAAWEHGKSQREVTSDERKYVYSALQQRHLPKMDDTGLVEFDKRGGSVAPTQVLEEVDVYAEVVGEKNVPWGVYFPILSGMYTVLLALVGLGVPPLTVLSGLEWGLIFVASFLVSSIVFLYDTRRMKLGSSGAPPEAEYE